MIKTRRTQFSCALGAALLCFSAFAHAQHRPAPGRLYPVAHGAVLSTRSVRSLHRELRSRGVHVARETVARIVAGGSPTSGRGAVLDTIHYRERARGQYIYDTHTAEFASPSTDPSPRTTPATQSVYERTQEFLRSTRTGLVPGTATRWWRGGRPNPRAGEHGSTASVRPRVVDPRVVRVAERGVIQLRADRRITRMPMRGEGRMVAYGTGTVVNNRPGDRELHMHSYQWR